MTRRSVLEEHARRRERNRELAEFATPDGQDTAPTPPQTMGRTSRTLPPPSPPEQKENSRLKEEARQLKKKLADAELEKSGPVGERALKIKQAREEREADLERKEQQRHTVHLASIHRSTKDEGEKTRKLAVKHHDAHMKELKKASEERKKKTFWERGTFSKIAFVLGALATAYITYRRVRGAISLARALAPAARLIGRVAVRGTKALARTVVNAAPSVGRAAQRARIAAKRAARKIPKGIRRKVRTGATIARAGFNRLIPRGGSVIGGLADVLTGGVTGLAAKAVPLAAAGYAGYKGVQNLGTVFDGSQTGADRLKAGTHLLTSGAGGVIGGVLGGAKGAALGAAGGEALAQGADKVGAMLSGTSVGDAIGKSIAVVMSPFSEDARNALRDNERHRTGIADDAKAAQAARVAADKENVKNLTAAVAPIAESTKTFSEKLKDYADIASNAAGKVWGGIKNAAGAVAEGVYSGASKIKSGYDKGGIVGAVKTIPDAATTMGSGVAKGRKELASGVSAAAAGVQYDLSKGSKSQLELAMGFQGRSTVKGLSDSQTRALAGNTMATESGGKLGIVNPYGYSGQYQMGADALVDNGIMNKEKLTAAKAASKAAGRDWYKDGDHKAFMADTTNYKNEGGREAFLKDKQLQDDTFVKYTNRNVDAGMKSGALTGVSTPEQIAAYAKAAHLKGAGGANDLMLRGKDSADANGTKVSTYAGQASKAMNDLAAKVDASKATAGGAKVDASTKATLAAASTAVAASATKSVAPPIAASKIAGTGVTDIAQLAKTKEAPTLAAQAIVVKEQIAQSTESKIQAGGLPVKTEVRGTSTVPVVAPMTQATATPQPTLLVSKSTPTEAQSLARETLAMTPAPSAPPAPPQRMPSSQQSGVPTLDEMPVMISDLGLVLLQIGHV